MTNSKYSNQEELILLGKNKGYFSLLRDASEIVYRASGERRSFKDEREKIRAYFLVALIEKYKYSEKDIQLDVEVPGLAAQVLKSADLVVYKNSAPFIIADCREKEISDLQKKEMEKDVVKKAEALKAQYAVAVIGSCRTVFNVSKEPKQISDIPVN